VVGDQSMTRFSTNAAYRQVLVDVLARDYPLEHEVIIYRAATLPIERPRIERIALGALAQAKISMAETVVIPPARPMQADSEILARLDALDRAVGMAS
jgi:hypothetical protein